MNLTIAVTRSTAGAQSQKAVVDVDIEQRPYNGSDPQYMDWLIDKVNPLVLPAIAAAPGDHIGVTITASTQQPELVNVAWNFKS